MSLAERLLSAFEGSSAGHGQTTVGRVGRTGKVDANSRIVRENITVETWCATRKHGTPLAA